MVVSGRDLRLKEKTEFHRFLKEWGAGTEDHSKMTKGRRARSPDHKKRFICKQRRGYAVMFLRLSKIQISFYTFKNRQSVIEATRHP